jgi:hypothetical protein
MNDVNKQLLEVLKRLLEMDMRGQELQCLMEHSVHGVDLLEECNVAIAAAEQAQQELLCVACEGNPSFENSPCALCGKTATVHTKKGNT